MNKLLLALGVLAASALLVPDAAEAQRGGGRGGGFGGGGVRMGGGGFGGGSFRGGNFGGGFGGSRMYIPRAGMGSPLSTGSIAARPIMPGRAAGIGPGAGGLRQAAIGGPGRFDNRIVNRGDWRGRYPVYGGRYPYYRRYGGYYGRYPYYRRNYPYYGWGWGLGAGALIGAAATYPYYDDYPYYDYPYYGYSYPYATYQTPVASTAGGYCVTPARTCALINAAPIGTGCSCSTPGGRVRGTVQ